MDRYKSLYILHDEHSVFQSCRPAVEESNAGKEIINQPDDAGMGERTFR